MTTRLLQHPSAKHIFPGTSTPDAPVHLGERLARARARAGWTHDQVADRYDIPPDIQYRTDTGGAIPPGYLKHYRTACDALEALEALATLDHPRPTPGTGKRIPIRPTDVGIPLVGIPPVPTLSHESTGDAPVPTIPDPDTQVIPTPVGTHDTNDTNDTAPAPLPSAPSASSAVENPTRFPKRDGKAIRAALDQAIIDRGLTPQQAVKQMGITYSVYQQLINNTPQKRTIARIRAWLDHPVETPPVGVLPDNDPVETPLVGVLPDAPTLPVAAIPDEPTPDVPTTSHESVTQHALRITDQATPDTSTHRHLSPLTAAIRLTVTEETPGQVLHDRLLAKLPDLADLTSRDLDILDRWFDSFDKLTDFAATIVTAEKTRPPEFP